MTSSRTLIAATITTAAALAGAAPVIGQMPHPGGGMAGEHAVTINDAGYNPAEMVVAPGQHVIWTNTGVNPQHSIMAIATVAAKRLASNTAGVKPVTEIHKVPKREAEIAAAAQ